MNSKLTLISITFQGRRISRFIKIPYNERGQAIVNSTVYDKLVVEAGGYARGSTYTAS